jgi:hypothetical protein
LDFAVSSAHESTEPDKPKITHLHPVEPNISSKQRQLKPTNIISHADPTAKHLSHMKRYIVAIAVVFIAGIGITVIVIRKQQKLFGKEVEI